MKATVVFDSVFGNTAEVADAIADQLKTDGHDVSTFDVHEARDVSLEETELLVVGSPTRGFGPTPDIAEYVAGLDRVVPGKLAAAFDTRFDLNADEIAPRRWWVNLGGYAAARIGSALSERGYKLRGEPTGFLVDGTSGPLVSGEIARASRWARTLGRGE